MSVYAHDLSKYYPEVSNILLEEKRFTTNSDSLENNRSHGEEIQYAGYKFKLLR
jgi:hypothetical protein